MDKEKKIQLKRVFGYYSSTSFLIVNIIGAGIFVSPKGVLKYSCMNVGLSLCIWAACAVLSLTVTLCSVEIGVTFPCCGAHYYFLKRCFGSMMAFLSVWTTLFAGPGIIGSQALLFAEYTIQPFYPGCSAPELPKKCLALVVLWIVGILTSCGVKLVTWLQVASTVLKMVILGFISLSGMVLLIRGREKNIVSFQNAFDAEFPDASHIAEAIFQGYFAYSGGGCFTFIAGEMKKPQKTIPRCVFTAMSLVTVVYLLVNISYLTVLSPREILSSDAVSITWINQVIPSLTWFFLFSISGSLFSTLMINVLELSREVYIAAHLGQLPLLFNMLNIHSSPFMSILLIVTMASTVVVLTNLLDLINYVYFMIFIWSLLKTAGILKLRYQEPNLHRPYKVFLPFALITIAMTLSLVVIPLVKSPSMHYVYVLLFSLSGLLFYIPFTHFKLKLPWFEKITCYLQLLLNICVPDESDEQIVDIGTVKKVSF